MPLITFSVQHGHTLDEAQRRVETAIHELTHRFGFLVQRVAWSPDHRQVRLEGGGCWITLHVDAQAVHVFADLLGLGRLLGGAVATGLKTLLQGTVHPRLPRGNMHEQGGP